MDETIRDYWTRGFDRDVEAIRTANGRTVSLVSLVGGQGAKAGGFVDHARVFAELKRRGWFLWTFFYQALLDQAVYSVTRADLGAFGEPAPLKIVGILASYHSNLHPALLLLAATLEVAPQQEEMVSSEFTELTRLEMNHVEEVIGAVERGHPGGGERVRTELSNAMALLFLPRSFGAFSKREPNLPVFESWARIAAQAVNTQKL